MGEAGKAGSEHGCDGIETVASTGDTTLVAGVHKDVEHKGGADTRQGDREAAIEQVIPRGSSNDDS